MRLDLKVVPPFRPNIEDSFSDILSLISLVTLCVLGASIVVALFFTNQGARNDDITELPLWSKGGSLCLAAKLQVTTV